MPRSTATSERYVGPVGFADALGWASVALAAPMLVAPRAVLRQLGLKATPRSLMTVRAVGVRELLAASTILGMRHRRIGAWSRVSGDLIDLSLLLRALTAKRTNANRLTRAGAFVGGILLADLLVAAQLSRAEGSKVQDGESSGGVGAPPRRSRNPAHVRASVTIRAPLEEVSGAFDEFGFSAFDPRGLQATGGVRFLTAPGDRGVEVHLDYHADVTGGSIGAAARKLAARSPSQLTNDELRRFKALLETGVEIRSEKTPEGPSSPRQLVQQPAQPMEATG